jgi:lysophospholipase-3
MQVLLSGNNLALPFVDPLALRSLQSSLWPLPSPAVFGAAQPLVTTKSRNYSAGDVAGFLGAIGLGEAVRVPRAASVRRAAGSFEGAGELRGGSWGGHAREDGVPGG